MLVVYFDQQLGAAHSKQWFRYEELKVYKVSIYIFCFIFPSYCSFLVFHAKNVKSILGPAFVVCSTHWLERINNRASINIMFQVPFLFLFRQTIKELKSSNMAFDQIIDCLLLITVIEITFPPSPPPPQKFQSVLSLSEVVISVFSCIDCLANFLLDTHIHAIVPLL